jgi:hypothetical protein
LRPVNIWNSQAGLCKKAGPVLRFFTLLLRCQALARSDDQKILPGFACRHQLVEPPLNLPPLRFALPWLAKQGSLV